MICRFLCSIFLHITLLDVFAQDLEMMKFALNHPWKFSSWGRAFRIGMWQLAVAFFTEVVNLAFTLSLITIVDVVSYFVAILVVSQFAQFFFLTVNKTLMGELLQFGKVSCGGKMLSLDALTKIEATSSDQASAQAMIAKVFSEAEGETLIGPESKDGATPGAPYVDKERKVQTLYSDRDFWNVSGRVMYQCICVFYKVFWFYFAPFAAFILSYWLPFQMGGYEAAR